MNITAEEKLMYEVKPPFEEVYCTVKSYIKAVLPKEKDRDYES